MLRSLVTVYFLGSAGLFFVTTAVAMLRFEDVYSRLHAGSKCLTGGSLSLLLALLLQAEDGLMALKIVMAAFFMLITNPVASHALARAAYNQGYDVEGLDRDEYRDDRQHTFDGTKGGGDQGG